MPDFEALSNAEYSLLLPEDAVSRAARTFFRQRHTHKPYAQLYRPFDASGIPGGSFVTVYSCPLRI
jgi:hypothetical protein